MPSRPQIRRTNVPTARPRHTHQHASVAQPFPPTLSPIRQTIASAIQLAGLRRDGARAGLMVDINIAEGCSAELPSPPAPLPAAGRGEEEKNYSIPIRPVAGRGEKKARLLLDSPCAGSRFELSSTSPPARVESDCHVAQSTRFETKCTEPSI